ncbi:MAG: T9SS type A sorting domain-containing protein [Crocinitomicaceae bacterium]|nr:T9SS type A sorting domain-containing protein [Crocinitomicaceae bacterium]
MKRAFLLFTAILAVAGFSFLIDHSKAPVYTPRNSGGIPIPTQVYTHMQDEEGFGQKKRNYFDLIHGNFPDWRKVNEQNFNAIYEWRAQMRHTKTVESFANGAFEAEWIERGSNNQAGNVQVTDFDTLTESIYAISDGGVLWKGDLNDGAWTPLNEDIQFGSKVLNVFYLPGGDLRIIAARGHGVFYSDDEGLTWNQSTGFTSDWDYGSAIDLVRLNDAQHTLVYLYNAYNFGTSDWQNRLAYSTNDGASWTIEHNFTTTNNQFTSLDLPYGASRAYLMDGSDDAYYFEGTTLTPVSTSLGLSGLDACYLTTTITSTDTTLYVLMDNTELYKSTDQGLNYTFISSLPVSSWEAGIEVSIDDPDILYMGEMELWRSTDGGLNFNKLNELWEYYGDVPNKIHADIMSISSFKKSNGEEFTLIPNHGGLSASYDQLATTENIGMLNLNVGQFYDALTSPINSNYVFGGTQDQGFQRSTTGNLMNTSNFEQVISGDYGQMQFSNNGNALWIQYPGADFAYYENAMTDPFDAFWFNIDGTDMANYDWIVPTEKAPNPSDDFILVGGGEVTGGSGSYLIKLENDGFGGNASQYDFDFLNAAGGTISAIGVTPLDENRFYVATENGKFFYSNDAGSNWNMTSSFDGPEGDWLFGATIYASRQTPDLVYFGGSGYSNDAVFVSTDGGATFNGIWPSSLPETAVHELCMDPAEKFLFAATDAGPYVYVVADDEWYSLLGLSAPVQEYMSCEFVEAEHLVRFSTWGRGIWDLKLQQTAGANEMTVENLMPYPNPSSDGLVNINSDEPVLLIIYNMQGEKVVSSYLTNQQTKLNLSHLEKGVYVFATVNKTGIITTTKWIRN